MATRWFKSSYSGGNATECVECAQSGTGALVRDSKQPTGGVIAFGQGAWQAFVNDITCRERAQGAEQA
ncbi:DUF397 domain-containing protein [Streptomyces sp. NPDC092046]|uniref:DUF397 domain-containing protein n=1 Tax=Streptomyces sp. NPDC092046 TaxID=3366009 RepID=UPI00381F5D05